jgi:hypothetical protein
MSPFYGFPYFLAIVSVADAVVSAKNVRTRFLYHAKEFHSATPAMPSRRLSARDWTAAAGKFTQIGARREGVTETIWATSNSTAKKCGSPCVAHCIAGQPRDMIHVKGLWKSIKYRLFEQFSHNPVIFALLAMGAEKMESAREEGGEGYVRQQQESVDDEDVRPSLEFLGVDRALLLREACTTGSCLQEGLRLKCDAKKLGNPNPFDEKTGKYTNMCEIQVSRFRDALELVRDYEDEHKMKFDWVTRPRPDVYFTRPVAPVTMLDTNSVHVSPWAACGFGGMDWFYAMPRKFADTYAEFSTGVSCDDYFTDANIATQCNKCLGCECWQAAWMMKKNLTFTKLPWQWFIPGKFCGDDCPADWEATAKNIMGLDKRAQSDPCVNDEKGFRCPMLMEVDAQVRKIQ